MSDTSIMSMGEIIETAFGDPEKNTVNFKLIETVLYILARQLRILERRVGVEIGFPYESSSTSISVTEVKIHANIKRRRKLPKFLLEVKASRGDLGPGPIIRSVPGAARRQEIIRRSQKTERGITEGQTQSVTTFEPTDVEGGYDNTGSGSGKSQKSKTYKSKDSKEDETEATGKPGSQSVRGKKTKSAYDTESKDDREKKSTGKSESTSPRKQGKSESDKSTSKSGTRTDKSTLDGSSPDSVSDLSVTDLPQTKTKTGDASSPSDATSRSKDKKRKQAGGNEGGPVKRSESKTSTTSASRRTKNYKTLEQIEEEREKVLRIIHQRTNSFEEDIRTPTPMASLDSTEVQHEKILVVERVPSGEIKSRQAERTPRLSIVTQEEFEKLVQAVIALENKSGLVSVPGFPDSLKLLENIKRGTSLTDAMAGLQLSARLEIAEKALEQITDLLVELAKTNPVTSALVSDQLAQKYGPDQMPPGKVLDQKGSGKRVDDLISGRKPDETIGGPQVDFTKTPFDATGTADEPGMVKKQTRSIASDKSSGGTIATENRSMASKKSKSSKGKSEGIAMGESPLDSATSIMFSVGPDKQHDATSTYSGEDSEKKKAFITVEELESAMRDLHDEFQKALVSMTTRSNLNADNAIKIAKLIEKKIEKSLDVGDRMTDLENAVADYCEQINVLDTGLSTQMTNYQEQLTQMQHDLEVALETMAEALANLGGDTDAMGELNQHFAILQSDFDTTRAMQKELSDIQYSLSMELERLKKEIEVLRGVKSDRDEVADALRDKAGIDSLNGLVTHHQFDAVRGDIEKNIRAAYDKFNNQEIVWQKAIDDLLREINEKASIMQVSALRNDINSNLEMLKTRLESMIDLMGEPRAAALTRAMFRDTNCLSCASPAYMSLEEDTVPKLPAIGKRPPTLGQETPKPKDDGDHLHAQQQPCYPGYPIPHPLDPRSQFCTRYCGGAHTLAPHGPTSIGRIPPGVTISRLEKDATVLLDQDGKPYKADNKVTRKPCRPCNLPPMQEKVDNSTYKTNASIYNTSMTPTDLIMMECVMMTDSIPNASLLPVTEAK